MLITLALLLAQGVNLQPTTFVLQAEYQAEDQDGNEDGDSEQGGEGEVMSLAYNSDEPVGKLMYISENSNGDDEASEDDKSNNKEAADSNENEETEKDIENENVAEEKMVEDDKDAKIEDETESKEDTESKLDDGTLDNSAKADKDGDSVELEQSSIKGKMEQDFSNEMFARLGFEIADAQGINIQQVSIAR